MSEFFFVTNDPFFILLSKISVIFMDKDGQDFLSFALYFTLWKYRTIKRALLYSKVFSQT